MPMRRRALVALVTTCVACCGESGRSASKDPMTAHHKTRRPENMILDSCQAAARAIRERQFVGWRGLPVGCTSAALVPGLPEPIPDLAGQPARFLGSDASSAAFVVLELPGWYQPMASFRDGAVVLVALPRSPREHHKLALAVGA